VAFHPFFLLIATASDDCSIKVWEYESEGRIEKSLNEHTGSVNDICFDKTGRWLASASNDMSIKLWEFTRLECTKTLHGHDAAVSSVAFVSNGESLISGSRDKAIKIWDTNTGFCFRTLTGHTDWVRCVATPADGGNYFASCGNSHVIYVWNLAKDESVSDLVGHDHVVEDVVFADSVTLGYLKENNRAPANLGQNVIDVFVGRQQSIPSVRRNMSIQRPRSPDPNPTDDSIHVSKAGPVLFSASRDKTIKMWDVFGGKCLSTFGGHDNWVKQVILHPSGKFIVSCSDDRTIRLWDVLTEACVKVLALAHSRFITSLSFSPKSGVLASGSLDCTVKIWACRATIASK